jgi:hypothetical protein
MRKLNLLIGRQEDQLNSQPINQQAIVNGKTKQSLRGAQATRQSNEIASLTLATTTYIYVNFLKSFAVVDSNQLRSI